MFAFQALASGSSGNAYLLRTAKVTLLIEAGLRLPVLTRFLAAEGVSPRDLTAVLISHEHRDHCVSARDLADEHRIPVGANIEVLRAAGLSHLPDALIVEPNRPTLIGDVEVTTFPVRHDAVCPVGFLLRIGDRTIALATDLGEVNGDVIDAVALADLVVLEANHDVEMLAQSRYPHRLRKRVAGPTGHLSNAQAGRVLADNLKSADTQIWLAHLSKENNTAALAARTVRRWLGSSQHGPVAVDVALRDRPSLRWNGQTRPRQLSLFPAVSAG